MTPYRTWGNAGPSERESTSGGSGKPLRPGHDRVVRHARISWDADRRPATRDGNEEPLWDDLEVPDAELVRFGGEQRGAVADEQEGSIPQLLRRSINGPNAG